MDRNQRAKQFMAERREQRRKSGLCLTCGKVSVVGLGRETCDGCFAKHTERMARMQARRKEGGLCPRCGSEADEGHVQCARCLELDCEREKARRAKLNDAGRCGDCGAIVESGNRRCDDCRERQRTRAQNRRKRAMEAGLCHACGRRQPLPGVIGSSIYPRCEMCYLRGLAQDHLGTSGRWPELKALLESQGGKCPYTGVELILGLNDSIDHVVPLSRSHGTPADLANLEWVCLPVNLMKRNKTKQEFVELCAWIAAYTGTTAPAEPTPLSVMDGFRRPGAVGTPRFGTPH